jgi:hypothetical protein
MTQILYAHMNLKKKKNLFQILLGRRAGESGAFQGSAGMGTVAKTQTRRL